MSILFCDSNSELWYDKVDETGINVIQMPYTIDGKEDYYDMGRKTDFKGFYDKIRKGSIPITSALNYTNYMDYFEPYFEKGEDILYITFSHKMSATFSQLEKALDELKEKYPERKCIVVDTRLISIPCAIVVYEAAKQFKEGKSIEEVADYARNLIEHTSVYFTVDDLHHLKRGGRLSGTAAVLGTLLSIKPILNIDKEGSIKKYASAKGRKKAIDQLFKEAEKLEIDFSHPVGMINADCDEKDIEFFKEKFKEHFGEDKTLWVQQVGPVIGTHCGPGTMGFGFVHKKDRI